MLIEAGAFKGTTITLAGSASSGNISAAAAATAMSEDLQLIKLQNKSYFMCATGTLEGSADLDII
jgi:hypothetical protein